MVLNLAWDTEMPTELPLRNYPQYQWQLDLDARGLPQFEAYHTVSRHLVTYQGANPKVCPYGDEAAPVARLVSTPVWQTPRGCLYSVSAEV
jgi:hypothetical protein